MRVGLLGGSFNPAHGGHVMISKAALKRLRLDEVWWLVAPQNPLKPAKDMARLSARLAGARALARHPRIRVSALESVLETRYSADTIRALQQRLPGVNFVWVMGADNLAQFPHWREWQQIFHLVVIAVFARPSYSLKALAGAPAKRFARYRLAEWQAWRLAGKRPPAWVFIHGRLDPRSSTKLRAARAGRGEA